MDFLHIVEGERGFARGRKRTYDVSVAGAKSDREAAKATLERCLQDCSGCNKSWNMETTEGRCNRIVQTFTLIQPFERPFFTPHEGCDYCTNIHQGNFHVSLLTAFAESGWELTRHEKTPTREWTFQKKTS